MFFGATAFAEAPFSAEGIINAQVQVTGVEATTIVSSVSIAAGGNIFVVTGAEVELQSTVNIVSVTANADVILNTNSLTISLGNEQVEGDANVTISTNLLTVSVGTVDAIPNTLVDVTGNILNTTTGTVNFVIDSNVLVTGINMTASTRTPYIYAWVVVNTNTTSTWRVVEIAA